MKKLIVVLALVFIATFCVAANADTESTYEAESRLLWGDRLEADIKAGKLPQRIQFAITAILETASGELKKKGYEGYAAGMLDEWYSVYYNAVLSHNIGDYEALSKFLTQAHSKIEGIIGIELCRATHIHDLFILNYTIPVALNPCLYDPIEYAKHFAGKISGEPEFGLIPVLAYWLTYGVCVAGSYGTGFIYLCGSLGGICENAVCKYVAPQLASLIWYKKCAP